MPAKMPDPAHGSPVTPPSEQPFPSTTWEWRKVKVSRPAGGQEQRPEGAPLSLYRKPRSPRVPLKVTVRHRGGPESWWEIEARGRFYRFPGYVCIDDAMRKVNGL